MRSYMRWDEQKVEEELERALPGYTERAAVRTFDAPEALDTRFYEVRAKSVLNRVPPKSRMPFEWTVNPYRGCSHACLYCFARPTHTYLGLDAGRDFEREIVVKVNAPEVLRAELRRPSWKRQHVAMGTNTDPYQWVESRYRLMPEIWQALIDSGTPGSILTKSPLLLRDIDLMKQVPGIRANLSIPTMEEKAWRATEPRTPSPMKRMEAVAALNRAGIPCGILIAPLMPGINDSPEQVARIIELADQAGAVDIGGITLHLRGEVKGLFFDWLRDKRPDLLPRYQRLYARGAYAPAQERERLAKLVNPAGRPRRALRGTAGAAVGQRDPARPGGGAGERPREQQQSLF